MTNMFERSFLMALGAAALTRDMAESFAGDLVKRGSTASDEGRKLVEETVEQAREETRGIKDRFDETLERNFREMGLVTSDEVEEMRLKIAQLEHRIALMEAGAGNGSRTADADAGNEALSPRLDTP
ncbi:MAG: phasin family protein [Thermoleophilia bacterium]